MNLLMIKKQQSNLPWFTSLLHITTVNMTLNSSAPVIYYDTMAVDQRFIYLKIEDRLYQDDCALQLKIDPESHLPSFSFLPEEDPICETVYRLLQNHISEYVVCPLLNKRKTYFVVYGRFYYSWMDNKNICTLLGATMPSSISRWDSDLLRTLLLRSSQLSSKILTHANCRHFDPICGTFIGLKLSEVSKKVKLHVKLLFTE